MQPGNGELVLILSGSIQAHADVLDALLYDGRFNDADIGVGANGDELYLTMLVPDRSHTRRTGRGRLGFRQTFEVPLYTHRLQLTGVYDVSVRDESETYGHVVRSIIFDSIQGSLAIDAVPPLTIVLRGAGSGTVLLFRNSVATDSVSYEKLGPLEIEAPPD